MKFYMSHLFICLSLCCRVAIAADAEGLLFDASAPHGGWRSFGYGVQDLEYNARDQELIVRVDWSESTWGVGVTFTVDIPADRIGGSSFAAYCKTITGSTPALYGGAATVDARELETKRAQASTLNNGWQVVKLRLDDMQSVAHGTVKATSETSIREIKFLIAKPKAPANATEYIIIRRPALQYRGGDHP